jgi:hypothetical protein
MRITIETGPKSQRKTSYQGEVVGAKDGETTTDKDAKTSTDKDAAASSELRRRQIVAGVWTLLVILVKARHFMKKRKD